jgi:hypothetical protein
VTGQRAAVLAHALALALGLSAPLATPTVEPAPARGDPLRSPDCRRAIARLDAEEAAAAPSVPRASASVAAPGRRGVDDRLAALRRDAANRCLARRADPPLPPQALVRPPPLSLAPLAVAPASEATSAAATARTAPTLPGPGPAAKPGHPYAITSCDAGGCWANDGSRLNRVGPNLWGPRGLCTVQGTLVQCP